MAERRQPRARPNRANDETCLAVPRDNAQRLARQLRGTAVERIGFVGDAELAESQRRAAEAVGLDRVGAGFEIPTMDAQNEIGPALIEDFGAILVALEIL